MDEEVIDFKSSLLMYTDRAKIKADRLMSLIQRRFPDFSEWKDQNEKKRCIRAIENWLYREVKKPNPVQWPLVVAIAAVLSLEREEAEQLLQVAGMKTLERLQQESSEKYHELFMIWMQSKLTDQKPIWRVPFARNPFFTGRHDLLALLEQQLLPTKHEDLMTISRVALTQPQTIKGLGGIGKTQIAVEYAYRSRDAHRYTHTLWINAANEETIVASFIEIAPLIHSLPEKDEADHSKLITAIIHWLEECEQRWLLIFDNADDLSILHSYLPNNGNGSILLTTRSDADFPLAASIEVENLGLMEGTKLLLLRAGRFGEAVRLLEEDKAIDMTTNEVTLKVIDDATNLTIALYQFPLALDQAGAYINAKKCSIAAYHKMYLKHREELLAQRGLQAGNYPDSVATTWSLSFQRVEKANPAAAQLLHLCAFLAPDRIPVELIKDGAVHWPLPLQRSAADLYECNQMIGELLKFSLVKRLTDTEALSIHRIVQTVQRDRMEEDGQKRWAERVVRAVNDVFPTNPADIALWPQCLRYLDQAQSCHLLLERYGLQFIEAAHLLHRTVAYLDTHALYGIAERLCKQALSIVEQQFGSEHHNTAAILNTLAGLYVDQSKYVEAESLYQRALSITEQRLGSDDLTTASCINNLALLYQTQGKYAEAEPLYQRALSITEQRLGSDHPTTATCINNLAGLYKDQGRYEQAEPLYQRALVIRERTLDSQHPDIAMNLRTLAGLYRTQGKYAEAEPLYQRALSITEQLLGSDHPATATSLNNLAGLYTDQGKYAEAELLCRRALSIYEQRLEGEHPTTVTCINNLALLYVLQDKNIEAEPLYHRVLSIYERKLGSDDPKTRAAYKNHAFLLELMKSQKK